MVTFNNAYLAAVSILAVTAVGLISLYLFGIFDDCIIIPNPTRALPPSLSHLRTFKKAAVCSDSVWCSQVGKSILERNGSAVDAAIAALFCNGVHNMQSMGIGGGLFMTIYIRKTNSVVSLNARDAAPLRATPDVFQTKGDANGPLSITVPGELSGYWEAHQRFGKLPWKELVDPTIELCHHGFDITMSHFRHIFRTLNDTLLKELFTYSNGTEKEVGSMFQPNELCNTLSAIAKGGVDVFYKGEIGKQFLEDVRELGGLVTQEDLDIYKARFEEPIKVKFRNGDCLYSNPPPASGLLLAFIMSILDGFNFTVKNMQNTNNAALTYNRMIEAFKYTYAARFLMADPNFADMTDVIRNLTSPEYAETVRAKISGSNTHQDFDHYGSVWYDQNAHGTAHISVLAENGDAVSVTSSVNHYFGCGRTSRKTGIVLSSGMDDFYLPKLDHPRKYPINSIAPQKRPLSSMAPTILIDKNGEVVMVIGAGGGIKIVTSIAQVMIRNLWLGQTIKEAIDAPTFHHYLKPMLLDYEYGVVDQVVKQLKEFGHETERIFTSMSIVCAIVKNNKTIYANADYRKGGDACGIN